MIFWLANLHVLQRLPLYRVASQTLGLGGLWADLSPHRTKKIPRDNKAQTSGQNKSLYPPSGYKNSFVSSVWKKFKVLEAETSEKKIPAAEKKLELMKTAKTKSTKASIFVSSDPFSFSPSQSPESYFCSDFHVFRLAPFFYYRLIFLIFGLILRSTTTHIL